MLSYFYLSYFCDPTKKLAFQCVMKAHRVLVPSGNDK